MACCLFAAFLMAQCLATLRRWGVFWGVVRADDGEDAETIYRQMAAWLERPALRVAVTVLVAFEMMALGTWIYVEHGTHIARLTDRAVATLRGTPVIYTEICTTEPGTKTAGLMAQLRLPASTNAGGTDAASQ